MRISVSARFNLVLFYLFTLISLPVILPFLILALILQIMFNDTLPIFLWRIEDQFRKTRFWLTGMH